jgi:hypothetical protein
MTTKLTADQKDVLARIVAAGPEGLLLDKSCVAGGSLLRKGLVTRVDVETLPATKVYSDHAHCYTIRGKMRYVTMCRYTAVPVGA